MRILFLPILLGLMTACSPEENPAFLEPIFFPCNPDGTVIDPTRIDAFPEDCTTLVFDDDLTTIDNNDWNIFNETGFRTGFTDENDYLLISETNGTWISIESLTAMDDLEDYDLTISLRFLGVPSNRFQGITWGGRGGLDDLYRFAVTTSGRFHVVRIEDRQTVETIFDQTTDAVNPTANTLQVRRFSGATHFFINGNYVGSAPQPLPQFGTQIGFSISGESVVQVERVMVRTLRED